MELNHIFKRQLRLVFSVGKIKTSVKFESVMSVARIEDLPQPKADELRADLIVVGSEASPTSKSQVDMLKSACHEAGAVYLERADHSSSKLLEEAGFRTSVAPDLWRKLQPKTPEEYGEDYLARWGDTDFLANAKLAADQMLAHFPNHLDKKTARVIDVGCLNSYLMEALYRAGVKNIFGTDISATLAIEHNVNDYHLPAIIVGDFLDNTYPDEAFDVTINMEVLEHIKPEQTEKFVDELARITKKDGILLISTSEDWEVDKTHINCRNRPEWYAIFSRHGLFPVGSQTIFPGFNSFVLRKVDSNIKSPKESVSNGEHPFKVLGGRVKSKLTNVVFGAPSVGTHNLENREAWLEKTLAAIPNGKSILDAGAGELQYKRFCSHLNYTSQDFGQYDGQGDEVGLQTQTWDNSKLDIVSDIASIPKKDASFDAIMCIEVFEHIPHPTDAVKEFSRLLKKGGILVITAPVSSITHFAPFYFYNGYSRYYFEKVLTENGFAIKNITFNGNWFEAVAQEIRRIEDVRQQYSVEVPRLNIVEQAAQKLLLKKLNSLSSHDTGSSELSSHGIQVVATKE